MNLVKRMLAVGALTACGAAALAQVPAPSASTPGTPASQAGDPAAGPAPAAPQNRLEYDLEQLPATKGTVAHYTLTPRGDVDGFLLQDGTEVHVPPHLSTQIVFAARPGDAVTVRGLKALNQKLVSALSVTNDASGVRVVDNGPGFGPPPGPPPGGPGRHGGPLGGPGGPPGMPPGMQAQVTQAQGRVTATLHGPRGEANGAMLEDGTVLRLPPPEAARFADLLKPGAQVDARGPGLTSALGRLVMVQQIGTQDGQLSQVRMPVPPRHRPGEMPPPPPPGGGAPGALGAPPPGGTAPTPQP